MAVREPQGANLPQASRSLSASTRVPDSARVSRFPPVIPRGVDEIWQVIGGSPTQIKLRFCIIQPG
jgi:hypothetical protein